MKHLIALFLLLSLHSFILAQSSFERHYGEPSNFDEAIGMAPTADGSYLVAGTTANMGAGGFDMLLEKVDPEGNTVWQTTWGGTGNDGANQIIQASSGGFLLSGYTEGANRDRDFAAIRLDEEGNELWRVIRGEESDDEASCALEMSDGGLLLIGQGIPAGLTGPHTLLIRTDSDGDILWESAASSIFSPTVTGCALAADGGFFLTRMPNLLTKFSDIGQTEWQVEVTHISGAPLEVSTFGRTADGQLRAGGWGAATGLPFVVELDEMGMMGSYLEFFNNTGFSEVNSFALTANSKLWVSISPRFGDFNTVSPFLYLIDPLTEEILLSRTATELGIEGLGIPNNINTPSGEGFLLVGNSQSNAKGENGLLLRVNENVEEEWRKVIGTEGIYDFESGRMVVETADEGFLIAGTRPTLNEERNLWLIRTNANGNVQWSADFGSEGDDGVAALEARADGSFVVAGYRSDTLIVSAFADTGAPLWYREYSIGLSDGTFDLTTTSNNEILLTMPITEEDISKGLLMKLDAEGNPVWTQYYQPSLGFNATYGIAVVSDGGYFLCGCAENAEGNYGPLLLKTDGNGNELWSVIYESDDVFACLITAHQHTGGDILANGISIGGGTRPFNLRSSPDGDVVWAQSLELETGENSYFTWFSDLNPNLGQLVLFGRKSLNGAAQPQGVSAGTITVLNSDGAVEWERDYGQQREGSFRGGAATADGGIVAVGSASFENSTDVWLVKTEGDGTVGFTAPLLPPFQLSLSPNPASHWLQLDASGLSEGEVEVVLFTLNGQRAFSERLSVVNGRLEHSIPVAELPQGSYILYLRQGETSRAVKWMKQNWE